ncbi:MAG: T9SS type A sorting domain-containing protein [Marinilabiliaceae bacterium]|nr:T9SS type A sorting domain-containing protein [Marinilabiliaceae bacterium]
MKKYFPLLILLILMAAQNTRAELPVITMTTAMSSGNIEIELIPESDTEVSIRVGTTTYAPTPIKQDGTTISIPIVSSKTIEIYGTSIIGLICSGNQLTQLNVSNCPSLIALDCSNNQLSFATLPAVLPAYQEDYVYTPQTPQLLADYVTTGQTIDLSAMATIGGHTTTFAWKTEYNIPLTLGTDYTINNGVTQFIKAPTDKVVCTMTNEAFPDFEASSPLVSNSTTIVPLSVEIHTKKLINEELKIVITQTESSPVFIDFGDNSLTSYVIGTSGMTITKTLQVNTPVIKIYARTIDNLECQSQKIHVLKLPSAPLMDLLYCNNNQIASLDLTHCPLLKDLRCNDNALTQLNVNQCTQLEQLNCSSNQLTQLLITNCTQLKDITCSFNNLLTLDVSTCTKVVNLYCKNNLLTTLTITSCPLLEYLDCSTNQISTLILTQNSALRSLYCLSNNITSLDVSACSGLTYLRCNNNNMTFSTLPLKQSAWSEYVYAPQKDIVVPTTITTATPIDLSAQYNVNGIQTSYVWKTNTGSVLTLGTDYQITNGVTTFLKIPASAVRCEMTHASFPYFTDLDVLKTTYTTITSANDVNDRLQALADIFTNNNTLHLNLQGVAQVTVTDLQGRTIAQTPAEHGHNTLELPGCGLYLVRVEMPEGNVTQKVMVK